MSEPMTLILVYDEDKDNFFPIKTGEKPDLENNTHLIIDESNRKITLSFTPDSSLIEKRTIERRVASFIKTGYEVPGSQGLRIGAGLPLEKVDPKSGQIPDILLTHGHTFGKGKLVRDEIPDYAEKENNYEVEAGSAGTKTDVLGTNPKSASHDLELSSIMRQKLEEAFPQAAASTPASTSAPTTTSAPASTSVTQSATPAPPENTESSKSEGVQFSDSDEHLFILGQFLDMYIQKGYKVLVYKNAKGKYEFKTLKEDKKYFIDGNQLFQE